MDVFDVLIGINLLREGLDIPEVSLVAILDADKDFLLIDSRSFLSISSSTFSTFLEILIKSRTFF